MSGEVKAFSGLSYESLGGIGKELTQKAKDTGMKVVRAQT